MEPRLNPYALAPALMKQYLDFSNEVAGMLEHSLIELVKIRASQINGCANCLNMHTSDARKAGETEQRLHLLAAWREALEAAGGDRRAALRAAARSLGLSRPELTRRLMELDLEPGDPRA